MSFETLKDQNSAGQLRKILEQVIFIAPDDADPITTLTDETGEIADLPEGYFPVGLLTSDGTTFGSETESEGTTPFGYVAPLREDITSQTNTITFNAYEVYRAELLALIYGMDPAAVTAGLNELSFERPTLPEKRYYRLVAIGADGAGEDAVYRAKSYPRVSINAVPEESWSTETLSVEIALTAFQDDELGYAVKEFVAGPGYTA